MNEKIHGARSHSKISHIKRTLTILNNENEKLIDKDNDNKKSFEIKRP